MDIFAWELPLGPMWLFNISALAFLWFILKTSRGKGWWGEFALHYLGLKLLDKSIYTTVSDFYLQRPDGRGTTQLDHVVVSKFGIFVIETKNMKGKIYGRAASRQWTQYIGRGNFKFQNPIHQNKLHIDALAKELELPADKFHNLVFFLGVCTLKNEDRPKTVMTHGLLPVIKGFTDELLDAETVTSLVDRLREIQRVTNNRATRMAHIAAIKGRQEAGSSNGRRGGFAAADVSPMEVGLGEISAEATADKTCPRCGAPMVLRRAKRGENRGNQFWGCSSYPKCRLIQPCD
ncbi:nuclease-related domain-containing protein [Sulfuriroseicoccus oceanibius]|uniref:NERD domain-containing protein n=1 Tax=Sulfuriroseicoccus oceanibius TaxID=2707525 RepID=A0A6B3L6N1_9BACT|nr:NERD domain-containing protein [Sulfuriroseicoccus oceanibius]QQL43722.1 NERD domain-containing protein [Sulfuriroseicoccus oceanibius]